MIKKINRIFFSVVAAFLVLPFASAQLFFWDNGGYIVQRTIDNTLNLLSPILSSIIGEYNTSEFFFDKVLLLILLVIICKFVLDKTPFGENNKKISFLISAIISVLAIRFINENGFFQTIFIQYGVLGIAITTLLPMVIFFYVIHNLRIGTYGRKVLWTLYFVIMTAIWVLKYNQGQIPVVANYIYGFTLAAAIIFIFLDKSIHAYFGISKFNTFSREDKEEKMRKIRREVYELNDDYRKGIVGPEYYDREFKKFKEQIKKLSEE